VKLTKQVFDRLVLAVKAGNYRDAAAAYAGVGRSTFFLWLKRGKEQKGRMYVELLQAIEQAELEAEASMVMVWRTHMKSDYRAIRDFLERRYQKRWTKTEKVVHEGAVPVASEGSDSVLNRIVDSPETLAKYNDFLSSLSQDLGRQSGGPGPASQPREMGPGSAPEDSQ